MHNEQIGRRRIFTGVNLVLLGVASSMVIVGMAGAQSGKSSKRAGGQYICVGGQTIDGYTNVVYVLDSANRELIALRWDESLKQLNGVGYRDLDEDMNKENDR